jgi:hypothetical protein
MAITKLESDTVSKGILTAKEVLDKLKAMIDQLDPIYNSAGGVSSTLTQADLDGVDSFSGITKQQVDDGFYALTSTLKTAIDSGFPALVELAARG